MTAKSQKAAPRKAAPRKTAAQKVTGKNPKNGQFLPGNRFWTTFSRSGPPRKFEDPIDLQNACLEYFDWAYSHPILEEKLFSSEGAVIRGETGRMQAMTVVGLCVHIGISRKSWYDYAAREEFKDVCEWAQDVMYTQKFTGAAAGMLNQSIIARELGLAERTEISGPDKGPVQVEGVSARERLARKLDRLAAAGTAGSSPGGAE